MGWSLSGYQWGISKKSVVSLKQVLIRVATRYIAFRLVGTIMPLREPHTRLHQWKTHPIHSTLSSANRLIFQRGFVSTPYPLIAWRDFLWTIRPFFLPYLWIFLDLLVLYLRSASRERNLKNMDNALNSDISRLFGAKIVNRLQDLLWYAPIWTYWTKERLLGRNCLVTDLVHTRILFIKNLLRPPSF